MALGVREKGAVVEYSDSAQRVVHQ
jgi:hypothetical protein